MKNKENNLPKRNEEIELIRGAAMILVFIHHAGFPLGHYILGFHMPFFFLLSGYLYASHNSFDRSWGGVLHCPF